MYSERETDGLDRVLNGRVFALDAWLHERGVSEDEARRRSDEPEKGHDGRGEPEQGKPDHKQTRVKCFLRDVRPEFRACAGNEFCAHEADSGHTEAVYQGEPAKEKGERDEEERASDAVFGSGLSAMWVEGGTYTA